MTVPNRSGRRYYSSVNAQSGAGVRQSPQAPAPARPGPTVGAGAPAQSAVRKAWAGRVMQCASENGTLTRADFLRMAGFGAAAVGAATLGFSGVAKAESTGPVPVYPTGLFPQDRDELTAAMNGGTGPSGTAYAGGGTLTLKATDANGNPTPFNLGDTGPFYQRGNILIKKSVDLVGEVLPDGRKTTLYGGFSPLQTAGPVSLSITDLAFDSPLMIAVTVPYATGFKALRCTVGDVIPFDPGVGTKLMAGFQVSSMNVPPVYPRGPITGDVSITECNVDLPFTRPAGDVSSIDGEALVVFMRPAFADKPNSIVIQGNTITNCSSVGIFLRMFPALTVRPLVSGNTIDVGRWDYVPGLSYNNALVVVLAPSDILDNTLKNAGSRTGPCVFLQNTSGANFLRNNVNAVECGTAALDLIGPSNGNILSNNTVSGSALRALGVVAVGSNKVYGSNNIFTSNDLSLMTADYGLVCKGNSNHFIRNKFGPSSNDQLPCIWVTGSGNEFTNNDFTRTGLRGFLYQVSTDDWLRAGSILFDLGTSNNLATMYSYNFSPGDSCSQVADLTFNQTTGGSNIILTGDYACTPEKQEHLALMLSQSQKYQDNKARIEALDTLPEKFVSLEES